ncbi:MAG: TolC family protein [Bacteroidetes bacterium]|nr:TolC family protein [Bacteroidota bacterium]
MKQSLKIWIQGFLLLLLCNGLQVLKAQPIDSLIREVLQENPQLKALELEYRAAQQVAPQVGQLPDPQLGLGVFVLPPQTRTGPQWIRLGVTQMLPWKGTLDARESLADGKAAVHLQAIEQTQLQLVLEFQQNYLQLYKLREDQRILRGKMRFFEALESLALSRVETSKGSLADVVLVQVKKRELEHQLALLETKENVPLANLNALRAQPQSTEITIRDSLAFAWLPYDRNALPEALLMQHPGVRVLQDQQRIRELDKAVNRLSAKPDFGVGIDYLFVSKRQDMDVPNNGQDVLMPRVSLNLPLNKSKYEHRDLQLDLEKEALEFRKENLLLDLNRRLEQAWNLRDEAQLEIAFYQDQKEKLQSSLRLLQSEYSNQRIGMSELLELHLTDIEYERGILEAIVKSYQAVWLMESIIKVD